MDKEQLISPIIKKLGEEIQKGNHNAVDEFWTKVEEEGAPLIEAIAGDGDNVLITFIYRAKEEIKNVIVYGAFPSYRYKENQLEQLLNTDIWFKTYNIRTDVRFKYSFSVNDDLDDDYKKRSKNLQIDSLNPKTYEYVKDEEDSESEEKIFSLVELPNAAPWKWTKAKKEINKGNLELHRFNSNILKKTRRVWVYTPYDYMKTNEPYKLLVLTDGFDYINKLSANTVIDNLIAEGKIPPVVCVLIASDENRYEELTCNKNFADFIAGEIMPWVQENYNVSTKPQDSIIGGLSLGGLTASYLGLIHSELFGNVLSQSGSYWWEKEWLTKEYEKCEKLPLKFYLNVGVLEDRPYDDEPVMMDVINNMRDLLISKGYPVHYETFGSGHDYLSWGETLANGLMALIGK